MPTPSPHYFDLQVNGYAGVDFNSDGLTAEGLHQACQRLRADGVNQALVAIITADLETMCGRLRRVAELRAADPLAEQIIAGFHVEGPFISHAAGFVGAHPAAHACAADQAKATRLLEAGGGLVRLVTLAPERDPGARLTAWLVRQAVVVSAGHTDATLAELRAAIDAGLTMFTHLGNGCPLLLERHDNIVQRVLSLADQLWISFIADGIHIPLVALGNYLKLVGPERTIVVTDAIAAAGMGPGSYTVGEQQVQADDQSATWTPDRTHLVGSAATMPRMVQNLYEMGLSAHTIKCVTETNPHKALGI